MKRHNKTMAVYILIIIAALIVLTAARAKGSTPLIVLAFGIIVAGIFYYIRNYRCPRCNKVLPKVAGRVCPYCGGSLEEDDE